MFPERQLGVCCHGHSSDLGFLDRHHGVESGGDGEGSALHHGDVSVLVQQNLQQEGKVQARVQDLGKGDATLWGPGSKFEKQTGM